MIVVRPVQRVRKNCSNCGDIAELFICSVEAQSYFNAAINVRGCCHYVIIRQNVSMTTNAKMLYQVIEVTSFIVGNPVSII